MDVLNIFSKCAKYASQEREMEGEKLSDHESTELVSNVGGRGQAPNL